MRLLELQGVGALVDSFFMYLFYFFCGGGGGEGRGRGGYSLKELKSIASIMCCQTQGRTTGTSPAVKGLGLRV